jgi:hypothetical protein
MPDSLLQPLHREVATIALAAAAPHGFVLGGGNALIAHGVIQRPTHDVDLMTDRESGVKAASGAVETALREAGYTVEPLGQEGDGLADVFYGFDTGLMEWNVTSPTGQTVVLQIAHFDRNDEPVIMDIGPVMSLADSCTRKTLAALTRVEERDYADLAAALRLYSVQQLIGMARRLDPSITDRDVADAGRQLDRMPDDAFYRYGLGPADVAELRERFADWPRS